MNDKPYLGALLLITLFACQPEPLERSEPTDTSPPHPTVVAQPTPPTTDPVSQAVPDGAPCGVTVTTAQGTVYQRYSYEDGYPVRIDVEAPDGTVLARTTIHRAFEFVLRVEEDVGVDGSIDAVESFDYDAFGRLLGNSRTEQDVQVYTMERELIFAGGYVVGMVERIDQDGDGQLDDTYDWEFDWNDWDARVEVNWDRLADRTHEFHFFARNGIEGRIERDFAPLGLVDDWNPHGAIDEIEVTEMWGPLPHRIYRDRGVDGDLERDSQFTARDARYFATERHDMDGDGVFEEQLTYDFSCTLPETDASLPPGFDLLLPPAMRARHDPRVGMGSHPPE